MAKFLITKSSIIAQDKEAERTLEAFHQIIKVTTPEQLAKITDVAINKPMMLKMGLPYLAKL